MRNTLVNFERAKPLNPGQLLTRRNSLEAGSMVRQICNAIERKDLSTALLREREQLTLFRKLVEHSGDMLLVFQLPKGYLVDANQAARDFLGLSDEQIRADAALTRTVFPELLARIEDDPRMKGLRLQTLARHADGHELALELDLRRVRAGTGIYLVASGRDMSDRQRSEDHLRAMLLIDGLTGVHNRRAFDERLEHEHARAARAELSLGLLMIDIDYFKNYNDQLGHLAGDQCLREVAQIMASSLRRPTDFLARYGGEEFAVILPDYTVDMAIGVALKLQEMLFRAAIPHPASKVSSQVTISVGIAVQKPKAGVPREEIIGIADRHLYAAKRAGRNRIDCGGSAIFG